MNIIEKVVFSFGERIQLKKLEQILGCPKYETEEIDDFKSIKESISYLSTSLHDYSIKYLTKHFKEIVEGGVFFYLEESICNEIIEHYFDPKSLKMNFYLEEEGTFIFEKLSKQMSDKIVMHFLFQMPSENYTESMRTYISNHLSDDIISCELSQIVRQYLKQLNKNIEKVKENAKENAKENVNCEEITNIISYLRMKNGPEIINNKVLKITGGGNPYPSHPISEIISNKNNAFYINNYDYKPTENDDWIEFDFGKLKVNLKSYIIKKKPSSLFDDDHMPKSWRISGSNDRKNWKILDHRKNEDSFLNKVKAKEFICELNNEYYRYIRYDIEESWFSENKYLIEIGNLNLFGKIAFK